MLRREEMVYTYCKLALLLLTLSMVYGCAKNYTVKRCYKERPKVCDTIIGWEHTKGGCERVVAKKVSSRYNYSCIRIDL